MIRGDFLWVYDKEEKLLMKIKRSSNRLYKLLIESGDTECLLSSSDEVAKRWHARLGDVNYQALSMMFKERMVRGLPKIVQPKDLCSGCLMSKQIKRHVPTRANFNAKKVLELIHGDLCGPITPETTFGKRYFFLLVDDFSRVMWVYMLNNKSGAFGVFKNFRALVENGNKQRIKVFRTDTGGEFMSNEFKNYCKEANIIWHYTAPYTPQQNGVVERRNQTVMEMARSYLKEMKLPGMMWGEAVRHAVYVLNRLLTRALTGVASYEAWYGKKPNVEHIRVFGCLSHMKVPSVTTRKLVDHSICVINLGREPGSKAYRLYNPKKKRIYVSNDVTFEENKSCPWEREEESEINRVDFPVMTGKVSNDDSNDVGSNEFEGQEPVTHFTSDSTSRLAPENYDDSREPEKTRLLSEVYNDTEKMILDEELFLMGVEEPTNYKEASKDKSWKKAMEAELDSIERNGTSLTELPPGHKVIGLK